jgi:hypothetical protein
MLALYLLSGISGVVFSLAFNRFPSVGASGAIFGLLGALAMFLYLHRGLLGPAGRMQLQQLVVVGALNLVYGAMNPGIDLWGHIGGLAAGAACAAYWPQLAQEITLGFPWVSPMRGLGPECGRAAVAGIGVGRWRCSGCWWRGGSTFRRALRGDAPGKRETGFLEETRFGKTPRV